MTRGRAVVARRVHSPKVVGSTPTPATKTVQPEVTGPRHPNNTGSRGRHPVRKGNRLAPGGDPAPMTNEEKKHLSRVADLGCAVCRRMGFPGTPAEIHHKRAGTGAGRRSSHWEAIPLCPEHHRGNSGIHGMGRKSFEKKYALTEEDLLEKTLELLNDRP